MVKNNAEETNSFSAIKKNAYGHEIKAFEKLA